MRVRFDPEPLANTLTRTEAQRLLVYSSGANPGAVSLVVHPIDDAYALPHGLRLTRAQVETLRDALTDHLKEYPA